MTLSPSHQQLTASLFCLSLALLWLHFGPIAALCLLAVIGSLLLPYFARFAFFACCLFVVFSYFRIHEAIPVLYPFRIPQMLALASLALLVMQIWFNRSLFYWHPLHSVVLLFVAWVGVSVLFATNTSLAMAYFNGQYIKMILMMFAISWLTQSLNAVYRLGWLLIMAGCLIAMIALYNSYHGIGLVEGTRVTISRNLGSIIGDPNDLALVLLFPLSFAVAYLQHSDWRRYLSFTAITLLILAILATQSRGGLIGIAGILFVMLSLHCRNKMIPILISIAGLCLLVAFAGISDRASGGAAETGVDESAMGRLYAWSAAWRMALSHPFTGVGIDNFYVNYYFYSNHWDGKNHAVHSTWFEILAETGFVGFALFALLIIMALKRIRHLLLRFTQPQTQHLLNALYLGFISFCISGSFLTQGFTWPLYILLALLIATERHLQRSDFTLKDQGQHESMVQKTSQSSAMAASQNCHRAHSP